MKDFCTYRGGLAAIELKKKHGRDWMAKQRTWKSANTKRDHMTMVSQPSASIAEGSWVQRPSEQNHMNHGCLFVFRK